MPPVRSFRIGSVLSTVLRDQECLRLSATVIFIVAGSKTKSLEDQEILLCGTDGQLDHEVIPVTRKNVRISFHVPLMVKVKIMCV